MNLSNLLISEAYFPANKNEPHVKSEIEIAKKSNFSSNLFLWFGLKISRNPGKNVLIKAM